MTMCVQLNEVMIAVLTYTNFVNISECQFEKSIECQFEKSIECQFEKSIEYLGDYFSIIHFCFGKLSPKLHKNENNVDISLYLTLLQKLHENILKHYRLNLFQVIATSTATSRRLLQSLSPSLNG